jgi:hypothetical protein
MEMTLALAVVAGGTGALLPARLGARLSPATMAAGAIVGALLVVLLSPTTPGASIAALALGAGMAVATDLGEGYLYFAPLGAAIVLGMIGRLVGGVVDDETGAWLSLAVAVGALGLYGAGRLFGRLRTLPTDPDSGEPMEAYGLFDTLLWLIVAATLPGVVAFAAFALSSLANGAASGLLLVLRAAGRTTPVGLPQAPFIAGAIVAVLLWISL